MVALLIRNVPEPVAASLRERAQRNGRSLQQELLDILAAVATEPAPGDAAPPIRLTTVRTPGRSSWRREEIYGDDAR
jgi:plasmid stability protein